MLLRAATVNVNGPVVATPSSGEDASMVYVPGRRLADTLATSPAQALAWAMSEPETFSPCRSPTHVPIADDVVVISTSAACANTKL